MSVIATLMSQYQDDGGNLTIPTEEFISLMESHQSTEVEKPKKRKTKKTKDPDAPKRAMSAYLRWCQVNRSQIKESLVEKMKASLGEGSDDEDADKECVVSIKPTEVMREAGKLWKALDASEKTPFEEAFKVDQERYKAEMAEYKPVASLDSYSAEEYPEAPEGWSGPYQLKYLWKHAGPDGKAMRFKDFEEAINVAATIDDCKGITKTSRWYELRRGPDLMSVPQGKEKSGLASWMKGTPSEPVVMTPTIKEEKVEEEEEVEVEEEEEKIEPVKKAKTKKSVMKKVKVAEPEPEPEPESESEDETEVDEVVIGGEKYYKDEDGTLYDPKTNEEVGMLVDGEIVKE